MRNREIIISSGWFFDKKESKEKILNNHEKSLDVFDGLEIHLTSKFRRDFYLQPEVQSKLLDSVITFHLPSTFDSIDTYNKILELVDIYQPTSCVIHPENKRAVNWSKKYDSEILIENMDKNKDYGTEIEEITSLLESLDSRLCLDLQHCYELGGIDYFKELYGLINDEIEQLHVSGQNIINTHSLVFKSNNKKIIKEMLSYCGKNIDKIVLEGRIEKSEDLYKEKQLVENCLNN